MKAALAAARETFTPLRTLIAVLGELSKARLTALVLITTLAGFFVARGETTSWLTGLHVMLGTAFVAAGAAALNQWWERNLDRLMERTAGRPLPAGLVEPGFALGFGLLASIAGVVYLAWIVNGLTAFLGAAAWVSYVLIYTPLKRRTTWNTLVGAVPGALPPLMGWAAARGELGTGGLALFGVLMLWQIPHFMAIAWLYRDQYAQAGFRMMPVVDPTGLATGWWSVICAALLIPVSLVPTGVGVVGWLYLAGALPLGIAFLWASIRFMADRDRSRARVLFFASIIYLPLLLGLLMLDSALRSLA